MGDNKSTGWGEAIKTGYAETLFNSYPDDAELAQRINDMFVEEEPITDIQVKRDRERFHMRPIQGELIKKEIASPTKHIILNKASQLSLQEAIAEILDNIFDNFQRNKSTSLEVTITAYPSKESVPGEIIIVENSGGIEKNRIIPLIQLGFSERSARGIGAWGEGFKMAVFALGEEVEVFSHYPGEEPISILFPKGWLDPKNDLWTEWKVNTYKVEKNPTLEGTTYIRINNIKDQVLETLGLTDSTNAKSEQFAQDLAHYFGEVYSEKYHTLKEQGSDISIKITVGDITEDVEFVNPVINRLARHLAFIPWLRPIRWKAEWETTVEEPGEDKGRTAKLEVEIFAGLAATFDDFQGYPPQQPGVEMWGNGRLFSLKGRINDQSVGWGYVFGGSAGRNPSSNASSRRLVIVALFKAEDSRDIPWAAPVKNDYNKRSEFYAEIQKIFAKVIRLFKDPLRLLDQHLFPFSSSWATFSMEEKVNLLFSNTDATDEFKKEFTESRFGQKVINFSPEIRFNVLSGVEDDKHTIQVVHGVPAAVIKDATTAAALVKDSSGQVVEYLRAIFPELSKQAELEEILGLQPDEELQL